MQTAGPWERLIVFTKEATPGGVKTRLIPALGAEGAARLQSALTDHTLDTARRFGSQRGTLVEVHLAGAPRDAAHAWSGAGMLVRPQSAGDLGERLSHALRAAFESGAQRVSVIGSDCPDLTPEILDEAYAALDSHDLVLGPALDGGYYLLGVRQHLPELFRDMPWGGPEVFERTLAVARRAGWKVHRLPSLSDVDEPEDLVVCRRLGVFQVEPPRSEHLVSVIIPAMNEASHIAGLLQQLQRIPDIEVIVVDGGSKDDTADIARAHDAQVIRTRSGRARQMNAGAAVARGRMLLFLHADSTIEAELFSQLRSLLRQPNVIAGAFRLRIDDPRLVYRLFEWGVNLRSRLLKLPYGDQGLFLRAETFFQLDGFTNRFMEDVEMCQRLRRRGRIALAPGAITTSARRWRRLGVLRTTMANQLCLAGYFAGVPEFALARLYDAQDGWDSRQKRS